MPLVAALGLFVSTDAPLLLCWSLALLFLPRALERDGWADWLAWGGGRRRAAVEIYHGGLPALGAAADRARRPPPPLAGPPQPWVAVLLAFAILSPNPTGTGPTASPTFRHTAEITRVGTASGLAPGQLGEFIGAQWLSFGPWGILLAWALARSGGLWRNRRTGPCWSSSCPCCCW